MSVINKGTSFSNGEQLTAKKINDMVDLAAFDQSATDSASTTVNTSGQIVVADGGINSAKLATGAIATSNLEDSTSKTDGVTLPKIQFIDTAKVLGRTTAGEGNVEELDFKTETDMVSDSDTAVASQKSIKAYVDANASTPSYVGISSNSSLTITQTDTSTTTHTYPIANFVGTGFNAAKVTGFYVQITASCRRLSTKTIADVKATFPDGSDHILLGHSCDQPEDQTSESRGTVFCPVSIGQTNLVIKPTLSGNTRTTTFTIVGCTQFV